MTLLPTIINVALLGWLAFVLMHRGWTLAAFGSVFEAGLLLGIYIAQEALFRAFDRQRMRR